MFQLLMREEQSTSKFSTAKMHLVKAKSQIQYLPLSMILQKL